MNEISGLLVFPKIEGLSFSVFLGKPVLSLFFLIFLVIYVVMSLILIYHWYAYGMRSRGVILAETLFLFISVALFVFAGVAITYY